MPKLGTILMIGALLAPSALAAPPRPRPKHASSKLLRGKLGAIKGRKKQVQAALHETRVQAKAVQSDLHDVNVRLDDVKTRLTATQGDLQGARRNQAAAETDLARTRAELAKVRERARRRFRAIAKQGDANVLVGLVTSQSVGELAERQDLMERIARKDHALFAQVRSLQAQVANRKERQDAWVARVDGLARRQRSQQSELVAVQARKGRVLKGLEAREDDLEASLKQFQDDEREIGRLIERAAAAERTRVRTGRPPAPRFAGRFRMPVPARITSGFGMRFHPILHIWRLHAGVDFGTPVGTPVHAAGPGEVIAATRMSGFGNVVIVDHGGGVSTVYGHLSRIAVCRGQRLRQGQTLGASGNSGLSTGPHLHWEVHVNGRAVNPLAR